MRRIVLLAFAVAALVSAVSPTAAASDQILCRTARVPRAGADSVFHPFTRLRVRDRLGLDGHLLDVRKPATFCVPTDASLETASALMTGYDTRATRTKPTQPRFQARMVDVDAPWGTEQLRVVSRDEIRVPALVATDPDAPGPSADLDELACYGVRSRRTARPQVVAIDGSPSAIETTHPLRLCLTADLGGTNPHAATTNRGWLCLAARVPRGVARPDDVDGRTLTLRDRFGRTAMQLGGVSELCVAVTSGAPLEAPTATPTATSQDATPTPQATPSPTPGGPVVTSLRVEPEHVVRMPGESYAYTAIAVMSDGSERNVTEDVDWVCGLGCDAPNTPGDRGRVVATNFDPPLDPPFDFTTSVEATDRTTGVWSYGVIFEVTSSPVPLIVYPEYDIIRQFTFDYMTALALDDQGAYRNATQDVVWSSTDPTVAAVANEDGVRSRVDGVAPGITTIYATDPRTGAVAGPATFEIFGPLVGIDVRTQYRSYRQTTATLDVGQEVSIQASPLFEHGFSFDDFDPVTFTSSHPAIAVVEPVPGATPSARPNGVQPRVLRAVASGRTRIAARDEVTGVGTAERGCEVRVTVREPVSALRLSPATRSVGLDETVMLTALGVGSDGTTRNFTQRVVYTSSDPTVVVATNADDGRSKLVVVAPGTAVISAVDPATGLASTASGGNTTITVRNERADGISVQPSDAHAPLGTFPRFDAVAHYPSGKTAKVNESVVWKSSAPDVADFLVYGVRNRIEPLLEGTTVVSVAFPSLGLDSATSGGNATLAVEPATALRVTPSAATIPVGGELDLHVIATLASGHEVELGADDAYGSGNVSLSSSDVAVLRDTASCEPDDWIDVLSAALGRAPGVATVVARWGYPPILTSTATGGDATVTVTAP